MSELEMSPTNDLGLTIEEAKAGLRVATAFVLNVGPPDRENGIIIPIERLRLEALFQLLMGKGVFTEAEYEEACRLVYNSDLARREAEYGQEFR
jgi:hypothetical protein